ncbi:MAG: carboxypeptidase-like regulatory domain-containing protein [Bacteroides sp.]|nr:carboxypeptidase-like regulatory domain-containing protein [Bacteroides sp.]
MKRSLLYLLGCLATLQAAIAQAPTATDAGRGNIVITGIVKEQDSRRKLDNVSIKLAGSNVGTVSNADGVFSLKVSREELSHGVTASHIGYLNAHLSAEEIERQGRNITIWMTPSDFSLNEVIIYGGDPRDLVEEAIAKIPDNYPEQEQMYTAFYRETIQKRRRYISVSEAVVDVYKTGYATQEIYRDKVQVVKGRRLVSQKRSDTLAVKVVGGPAIALHMDLVKHGDDLLNLREIAHYDFTLETPASLDNRMHHVVSFRPRHVVDYALYSGRLYIEQKSLSLTRAVYEVDMSDRYKATRCILHKKPTGLRFMPREISFLITYKQQEGKTYLNYVSNTIRFKCDWKRRLFSSTYTTHAELVMVDRTDLAGESIKLRDSFRPREVFYDKVDEYWDEDFWKDYNIIEPTESLESAVNKLKK